MARVLAILCLIIMLMDSYRTGDQVNHNDGDCRCDYTHEYLEFFGETILP